MSRKKSWPTIVMILLLLITIGIIGIYHPNKSSKQQGINVVTSLPFYQEAAQAVLGKYGKAISLINNASIDPHDFKPTTNDANQVAKANIIIENGLGYDSWLSKMSIDKTQKIINVAKLMNKHNGANEHLWYDMATMPMLTKTLIKKFSKIDPIHKKQFENNGQKYLKKLSILNTQEQNLAKNSHYQNVAVSEPVFDYALQKMHYHIIDRHFELAIENGTDPSPQDIANLQNNIKNHKIAFFVNNSQTSDHITNNLVSLAHQFHVPVLQVTETMPNNKNYIEWIHSEFNQLEKIQTDEAK